MNEDLAAFIIDCKDDRTPPRCWDNPHAVCQIGTDRADVRRLNKTGQAYIDLMNNVLGCGNARVVCNPERDALKILTN